jgi:hypothetical protein
VQELDVLAAQLPEGVRLQPGDDVLLGEGDWLFERDAGRRVLAQMRGDLMLARKAALRWVFVLESRIAWLGERGIAYVFGVAPCKAAVLADNLPLGVVLSPRRPIVQLLHRITEDESFAEVVYPLNELVAESPARTTFSTHDSRWNANGAFVGYRALMDAIPPALDVRRLEREDIGFDLRPAHGDLGQSEKRTALIGRPHPRTASLVSDNRVEGEGRMLVTQCDEAPPASCLFFGDWSAYRMLTYLSESFRRMVFAHLHTLDHELVEAERPDVVISLVDEAALIDLPADVEAPRAGEQAARKLSAGAELMPELAPLWGQE